MASQNAFKPVGANIKQDPSTHVGGTYGERKQLQSNHVSHEGNIQRNVDFYRAQKEAQTQLPKSNAQFLGSKRLMPHTKIEKGMMHARHLITDDVRVAFLDKIIGGNGASLHAENQPPANLSTPKLGTSKIK